MHLAELKQRLGTFRLTILVFFAMAVMAWFGFRLAGFLNASTQADLLQAQQSLSRLKKENESLLTEKNQLQVQITIANMAVEEARNKQSEAFEQVAALQEKIDFYQRVVAPEVTQEGFKTEALSVSRIENTSFWKLNLVLLQQRRNRAMVSGNLDITLIGTRDGQPDSFLLTTDMLDSGSFKYGFRYFQAIDAVFEMPENFVPTNVQVATTVYQFKKVRGNYKHLFDWQDALAN